MIFGLPPFLDLLLLSAAITFVISLFYKFLLDHDALKDIKEKLKEKQQKLKEAQNTNPSEVNQLSTEILSLTNKQLRMSMRPMFLTLVFISIVLYFIKDMFPGVIVILPLSLPFLGKSFGWLGWYIITSIPFSQFFRTMLGVEL
jgi:uncharacterized membrane protein (DUF106 family)